MTWILGWFGWDRMNGGKQVERVLATLLTIGLIMVLAVPIFGALRGVTHGAEAGLRFTFWAVFTAFAAFLTGSLVGLLFGLPTVRTVEFPKGAEAPASGAGAPSTGYIESTSLEQIADFLVKGLVALSLTTFDRWTVRFDALATSVTQTVLGPSLCVPRRIVCEADRVPGGLLLVGFALLGFLIAYLCMRRWFITEMVRARTESTDAMRAEREELASAQAVGLAATGASRNNDMDAQSSRVARMAKRAASSSPDAARASAQEVVRSVTEPGGDSDDPWRGAFGGSATADGCVLSATVATLLTDPDNFRVNLLVTVIDPDRRQALVGHSVRYFLHPTFGPLPREVAIRSDGTAPLEIFSYGAFTVGALLDDGTRLELNLARLPGAPRHFVER